MVDQARGRGETTGGDWADVVVVGAGAAGVGAAAALRQMGVERVAVVDRYDVGASFERWPAQTRFITPSFPGHGFGLLDLNAVMPATSPALMLKAEHPSGRQYQHYLRTVLDHVGAVKVFGIDVGRVRPRAGGGFSLESDRGLLRARHVVWAAGEFQYPRDAAFPGAPLCRHYAAIHDWDDLPGGPVTVVGGGESGIDAAVCLSDRGRRVTVLDEGQPWEADDPDPSRALSTYTMGRLLTAIDDRRIELVGNARVDSVDRDADGGFAVELADGRRWVTAGRPVLATGFTSSLRLVDDLFDWSDDTGLPALNWHDESTRTPGLFLAGPKVAHGRHVFCFIYKFRQRFPVVAAEIARRLGHDPAAAVEAYRRAGMYLDDPTCCGNECAC